MPISHKANHTFYFFLLTFNFFSFYFFNGNLYARNPINAAMIAGKIEKSAHTIVFTDSSLVMVTIVSPVISSVEETSPAIPRSIAMSEPEIAPPNFCAIVPEEKMRPVDDAPNFSVAKSATSAYIDQSRGE